MAAMGVRVHSWRRCVVKSDAGPKRMPLTACVFTHTPGRSLDVA